MFKKIAIFTLALAMIISMPAVAEQTPEEIIDEYTYGGTLTIGRTQTPEGMFNPLFAETVYDSEIWSQVFEGLTRTDPNFEPQPALALDWDVSDDYLTYTFYLDETAKFHDGEPVTAHDVKYTYEVFLHPDYDGVRASNFIEIEGAREYQDGEADEVAGINIIDDHTIEINMEQVHAPFLVQAAPFGIVPEHILGDHEVAELTELEFNYANPIGSGPFEFVEYADDEYTHLTAFEDYREGRPYLDDVIIDYTDDQALIMQIERGEIDFAPEVQAEHFDRLTQMDNINIHKSVRNGFGYIGFNVDRMDEYTPVQETSVRQAIAYGVNREGFHEAVMQGLATKTNSPISQASWAYTDELRDYDFNPERAQEILEEDGWEMNDDGIYEKDGEPLEFTITASTDSEFIDQMMALVQDNLTDIGMDVDIERMEFVTLTDQLDAGALEAWFMGWSFGADPDPYSTWHSDGDWNRTGWSNERADELIEEARVTLDQTTRRQKYVEFQEIWNEDMPYLPMYADIYVHAINDRVRGYNPDPGVVDPMENDWYLLREVWIPERYRD